MIKLKYALFAILISFVLGFFVRSITVKYDEKIQHIPGKPITGTVYADFKIGDQLKEIKTSVVDLPLVFWKRDTIYHDSIQYINVIPDSSKIIEDFILKREYSFNVFNNENGKLDINQLIQYNRLQSFNYTYTPIQKQVTSYRQPLFQPFTSISYNTIGYTGLGVGTFIKNFGVEYKYNVNFLNFSDITNVSNYHEFGIKFKF